MGVGNRNSSSIEVVAFDAAFVDPKTPAPGWVSSHLQRLTRDA